MTNEYDAMKGLADSKERAKQDYIADRNTVTRFEESEAKNRANEAFWRRVFISANTFAVMLVLYTLFHFLRG